MNVINRRTESTTKRKASKAMSIAQQCLRHAKNLIDLTVIINSPCTSLVEALLLQNRLIMIDSEHKSKLSVMQQIPHWCFRKNRSELEPRLYDRWLKSQAKAGAMVVTGK